MGFTVNVDLFPLVFLISLILRLASAAPDVSLTSGIVKGVDGKAVPNQKPYHAYYAIPYAQPPLGSLRFKPPQPFYANDPKQVINSDTFQSICIQNPNGLKSRQSEDCLYLNIFTPSIGGGINFEPNAGKKVMFWIHGGGFIGGDAIIYRPTRLVTEYDVIVVTVQYRLGPFGFLTTGDDVVPGNNGIRDQILALKWVRDNIRRFGGDPDDVTIWGQSAGGACANILALSPLTKGLFKKVIMQSGTVLSPSGISDKKDLLYTLAKNTDCMPTFYIPWFTSSSTHHQSIVNCLKKIPGHQLHTAYSDIDVSRVLGDPTADVFFENPLDILNTKTVGTFGPNVDGEVIPKNPRSLLADKQYMTRIGALDRIYMIGITNNEGILFTTLLSAAGVTLNDLKKENVYQIALKKNVQSVFPYPIPPEVLNLVSMKYAYPRDWQGTPRLQGLLDLISDTSYLIPSIELTRSLVNLSSKVGVFLYLFDHYPELTNPNSPIKGSAHALDLSYLFDQIPGLVDYTTRYANAWAPSSIPLIDIYSGMLTNFAKTGDPSLAGGDALWPQYDLQNESYMAISLTPKVHHHIYSKGVSLWTDFLPQLTGSIFNDPVKPFSV